MKCAKCKAHLDEFENSARIPTVCPSCGTDLITDNSVEMETLEETLTVMVQRYGMDLLKDSTRTMAYFIDLAPSLKKEKQMLQYLFSCGGNASLIDALAVSEAEQEIIIRRLHLKMTDEMFLSKEIAETAVMSFWTVISGKKAPTLLPQEPLSTPESVTPVPRVKGRSHNTVLIRKKHPILMGALVVTAIMVAVIAYHILKPLSNGMTKWECASIFAAGNSSYEEGDYRSAIESLSMLPSDFSDYDDAQIILKKSESAYCSIIIEEANRYVSNNDYPAAILLLDEAKGLLPSNTELTDDYNEFVSSYKASVLGEAATFVAANDYPAAIQVICSARDIVPSDQELAEKYSEYAEFYSASVIQMAKEKYTEYNFESISAAEEMLEYALSIIPNNAAVQRELEYYKACEPVSLLDLLADPSLQYDVSTYSFDYVESVNDISGVVYSSAIAPSGWYENSHPYGWSDTYSFAHYSWLLDYQYSKITGVFLFSEDYENAAVNVDLTLTSSNGTECVWTITNTSAATMFEMDLAGSKTIEISLRQSDIGGTFAYLADVYVWK